MDGVSDALVIGCGSIGTRHARNLTELGLDVFGYDDQRGRREAFADEVGAESVPSLEAGLDADPDVAIVAVPNSAHLPVAKAAAEAGVHLFVEKPLSHTEDGVAELVETADRHNLTTMVGCNMRFHPCLERFAELVDDEAVGESVTVRIEAGSYLPDWHPDEDYRELYSARQDLGGGVVLDYIHEIDYAQWLFGPVATVTAVTRPGTSLEIETEEAAALSLEFESGLVGQILLDYVQRPYRRSCRLVGSEGTLEWNWSDGAVRRYIPGSEEWRRVQSLEDWSINDMYLDEMRHFLNRVAAGAETTCPLREGWRALRVALSAKESAAWGEHREINHVPNK